MHKKTPLAHAISCALAAGALGTAQPVLAQQEEEADEQPVQEIVVTGSRIRKDVFTSSAPMDVILTEQASVRGITELGTLLQTSTVAAGAPQVTAATSTAFVQNGGTGAQTLSLRGLGANRTLVLLNGRRAGPAGVRGGVSSFDMNVLPLAAIERIEILKDGASSIYGSDAVAGVVNIFTKKQDGGTIDAYLMQPSRSGGEESRISASWGRDMSRGNFRLTADYYRQSELKQGDRHYFACGEQYIFDPDTGERADVVDPRTGDPACRDLLWGHVWIYDYQGDGGNVPSGALAQFDYDGDLGQHVPGFAVDPDDPAFMSTPPGWFPVAYDRPSDGVANADHPFQDGSSLIPRMERTTFFGEGEFDLTDRHSVYAEALLNRRKTRTNGYRQYWSYIYNENFFAGNPLSQGWTGAQWLSPTPITDHNDSLIEVDYQRFVAGLRGDLTENWSYDLSYQYSHSDGDYTNDQIFDDSIRDQNFLAGSCEGTVTSVRGVPCLDVPWLDPQLLAGNVSPEVRDFLFGQETGNTEYTQSSVEGYVTGSVFDLPAGPMGIAAGFHYAEDEIRDVPGEITLAGNGWGTSSAGITAGSQYTGAVFAEVDVPLLADRPGFENLTFSASGRYTDVNTYGTGDTYKVGLNWQIVPSIRVRANQSTSFRTPALFELYLADQTSFLGQRFIDPCINWGSEVAAGNISQRVADNCAATITPDFPDGIPDDWPGGAITATIIEGGGLGVLEAETSKSNTVGVIWQPEFAELSVAVDYFDIEVNDQIDQIGAGNIVRSCYDSEFWPNDPLCDLFDRTGVASGIDNVRDSFINVARQRSEGYDVTIKYLVEIAGGTLEVDTQHTFQEERSTALFAETERDDRGRFGHPKWVGRLWLTYDRGPWSVFLGSQFIGKVSNFTDFGSETATYRGETVRVELEADAVAYHDLSVTRYFDDGGWRAIVGVSNVLDEEPPQVTTLNLGELTTQGKSAFYSQYDWLGRQYFVNVVKDFE